MVVTPSASSASSRGSALAMSSVFACRPRRLHGGDDAAPGAGDLLIGGAGEPQLELMGAVAAENEMGVAVDQAGGDPAALAVDGLVGLEARRVGGAAGEDDAPVAGGDDAVLDNAEPAFRRGERGQSRPAPQPVATHLHALAAHAAHWQPRQ